MSEAAQTLTVRVPFASRKRGGRKLAIAADGNTLAPPAATDRQHARQGARARPQVEWTSGKRALWICAELAAAETINPSYVSRVLRLTLRRPTSSRQSSKVDKWTVWRWLCCCSRSQWLGMSSAGRFRSSASKPSGARSPLIGEGPKRSHNAPPRVCQRRGIDTEEQASCRPRGSTLVWHYRSHPV